MPPPTVSVAVPLAWPWQVTFVPATELVIADGEVTANEAVIVQRFASVAVTVYVLATTPFIFCVVAPLLHA